MENFHSTAISSTQDDEEIVGLSSKQQGWEHSNLLSSLDTTNITLSSDFLSALRKNNTKGENAESNGVVTEDEYVHGFKKTVFKVQLYTIVKLIWDYTYNMLKSKTT